MLLGLLGLVTLGWRGAPRAAASRVSAAEPSGAAANGPVVSEPQRASTGAGATVPPEGAVTATPPATDLLLTYSGSGTPVQDGPYTFYPVTVNPDAALAAALSGHLSMTMPDGTLIQMAYDRHIAHGDGNWSWIGQSDDGAEGGDAVLTFGPNAVAGHLPTVNGRHYELTTVGGHTYVAVAAASQLKQGTREGGDTVVANADSAVIGSTTTVVAAAGSASAQSTVDVLAAYSSGYRAYRGSASAATTAITNLIDVANRALTNSNITQASYRLVGTMEVAYDDGSDNSGALTDLRSSQVFASVRSARQTTGADLVTFVRRYAQAQNGCGLAYIPQAPYAQTAPDQTYSVVGDGRVDLGNGYYGYCPDVSIAHEMGHNLGAQHNKQQNATGGLYSYSYGYRNDSAQFYDVMAYGLAGQEQQLVYSTPDVSTCKGLPCGASNDSDVARTLKETMLTASSFRASVVPATVQPGQISGPSGRCIDVTGGATWNGASIQMWACNGLRQQQWSLTSSNQLQSKDISAVLDAVNYGTSNGTPLQIFQPTGAANQSFYFTHAAIVAATGRVIDAVGYGTGNGAALQVFDDFGTSNQRFTFSPKTGELRIDTGRCVDVVNYGTTDGTPVQLWDCNRTANQQFRLGSNGSLVGIGGKCLEIANNDDFNGAQVRMWTCNGGPNQRWRLRGEIRDAQANLCLDDPSGGTQNGAPLQLWTCLGNTHQQWDYQPN